MELSTFGAILTFAIELERAAAARYEAASAADAQAQQRLADLARAHRKRQQIAEQIRRDNVTEMILEPVYGLRTEDWALDAAGPLTPAALEGRLRGFYKAAAAKVSIPEVARRLRKMAQDSARLEEEARLA